jgi:hypothetical protein
MTTHQQAVRRSDPPRLLSTVLVLLLGTAALAGVGCTPDVPNESPSPFFELQFDPSATPPLSYQPTMLVTDEATQRLDFSVAGIDVPADVKDCQTQTTLPVAACEFYWYMEQLDGWPTLVPGSTPVSAPVNLATVTLPENLFVYESMRGQAPLATAEVDLGYDADTGYLTFDPKAGWDIGGLYLVAIRGYENGIKGTDGSEAVKSIIYALLQQEDSISCDATTVDEVEESCAFYSLFAGDPRFSEEVYPDPTERHAAIAGTLLQLEYLRQLYQGALPGGLPVNLWNVMAQRAQMPKEEVGILWAFRTHTASVVELNPTKGMVPEVSATEIHLKVKGTIDTSTVQAFSFMNTSGNVFLLDITAFAAGDTGGALPAFTAAYGSGEIVLTLGAPLVDGHQYALVLTNEITNVNANHPDQPGQPIVASPVTVFLRSHGALVDDYAGCPAATPMTCPPTAPTAPTTPITAQSLLPNISVAEACQLEDGRQQFLALFDDPTIKGATTNENRPDGLTRELVAYMYGFKYCAQ